MIEYIHPSSKEVYLTCGLKYQFQIEEEEQEPYTNWNKLKGSILHDAFYHCYDYGSWAFDDLFKKYINTALRPICSFPWSEIPDKKIQSERPDLKEQVEGYLYFLQKYNVEVVEREKTLQAKIGIYEHEGTLDLICRFDDTPEGSVDIVDFKTGNIPPKDALSRKIQLLDYYLLARKNGYKVHRVYWLKTKDLMRFKSNGKFARKGEWKFECYPARHRAIYPIDFTQTEWAKLEWYSINIAQSMKKRVYLPTGAAGPDPHCPMCPYKEKCKSPGIADYGKQDPMTVQQLHEALEYEQRHRA